MLMTPYKFSAYQSRIMQVNNILRHFATQTGVKINFHKSILIPINVPQDNLLPISKILGCKIGSFPFTYLGLPLSANRLKLEDFTTIHQQIERRLVGCSTMPNLDGRVVLTKYVFLLSLSSPNNSCQAT